MTELKSTEINLQEKEANKLYAARKYQQASNTYSQSADHYLVKGHKVKAAEMWNNQCVSLLQAKHPEEALIAVRGTALIFEASGEKLNQAMAYANEATALKDLGKKPEAIEMFAQSAELLRQINESDMYLEVMQSISALKFKSRNIFGALYAMQEGLNQVENPNLKQKLFLKLLEIPQNLMEK